MSIIKKFSQYIKESLLVDDDIDIDTDIDGEDYSNDIEDLDDIDLDDYGDDDREDREYEEEEIQEEGEEYEGTRLMDELSDRLGVPVTDNEIFFDGKKISFFSETEKFHIGELQFDSVDDVVSYLSGDENENEN